MFFKQVYVYKFLNNKIFIEIDNNDLHNDVYVSHYEKNNNNVYFNDHYKVKVCFFIRLL